LKSDFFNLLMATVNRELAGFGSLSWRNGTSVCVTMASKGYPGKYSTGTPISNLPKKPDNGTYVFHAGTEVKGNRLVTAGGRVLGVTAIDKDLKAARERAYRLVNRVSYDGAMFRTDIGFRELNAKEETAQHA
jgi:phosphoribosylamine--glycine ligase